MSNQKLEFVAVEMPSPEGQEPGPRSALERQDQPVGWSRRALPREARSGAGAGPGIRDGSVGDRGLQGLREQRGRLHLGRKSSQARNCCEQSRKPGAGEVGPLSEATAQKAGRRGCGGLLGAAPCF